ncbi:MAG: ATP-dependent DNA helicase RecG [Nitrospinae bacterium]|nr:ATP-dependent DNA helicase RecG [Nitrospinota bacterium]
MSDPIQFVKGVGPKRALLLEKLGLKTVEDGLFFLPHRYEDRSAVKKISQLVPGEPVTVTGEVINAGTFRIGRRRKIFELIVQDETGIVRAKWFKFNEKFFLQKYSPGRQIIISGKPALNRYTGSGLEFIHPTVEIGSLEDEGLLESGRIVPVYHTTEGLHLKSVRAIMKNLIDSYTPRLEEIFPQEILQRQGLPPRGEAFRQAHFPPVETSMALLRKFRAPAQKRLIFEELFLIQLAMAFKRKRTLETEKGLPLKTRGPTIQQFVKLLKFELTQGQKNVLGEIMDDLEKDRPMNRLLHGDVGSGKTIIALTSLLTAVDNGMQGALMAPTELLAEQHFFNIQPYCEPLGISLGLITSALSPMEKKAVQKNIREGKTQLVIGTHALIQSGVSMPKLALAITDEQHRFGVAQRSALRQRGEESPHALIMSATPIPRTLSLTLYGDLDISTIDELPAGRHEISTRWLPPERRDAAYGFLRKQVQEGRQGFVICPLVDESEVIDSKAATEEYERLSTEVFPDLAVGLLHGRLSPKEKDRVMRKFRDGETDILVSTAVVEVGIDVANATVMLIEGADRFGLAQLHQFRGRVGRGEHKSYCMLLSDSPSEVAKERLSALEHIHDGFQLAEVDLELRGPGDFFGTRQSGLPNLRMAHISDRKLLESAREEAARVMEKDPELKSKKHAPLAAQVARFIDAVNEENS